MGFCLARATFRERGNQVLGQVCRGQENVRQVEKAGLSKINRELKGRSHELELGFCLARESFRERGNQVLGQVSRGQENVRQVEKSGL